MRKNDSDFYMLVGRVEEVTDEGNRYVVKVSYEIFNRVRRQEETVMTTVYFQDQQSRMDDKKPIPWVQIARGKNIRPGRTVAMIVYFTGNDFAEAYGYGIYYRESWDSGQNAAKMSNTVLAEPSTGWKIKLTMRAHLIYP